MSEKKILNSDTLEIISELAHGELRLGTHAVHSGYTGLWNTEASTTTTQQYLIISAGTDTYINGDSVYVRAGNNSSSNELRVTSNGTTIGGNAVWHAGNLTPLTIGTTSTTAMAGDTTIPTNTNQLTNGAGYYSGTINLGGNDLVMQGEDPGDIVWKSADGTEKHRIWAGNGSYLTYRNDAGTAYELISAGSSGYNNSNWDTAYTYSQVGHLPLAGGTMTGTLVVPYLSVNDTAGAGDGAAQEVARVVNTRSGATSGYMYIGAASGTDWRLGKNILGTAGVTNFGITKHSGTDIFLEIDGSGNTAIHGTIAASNFSGSSSGTNTGDQTLPTLSSLGALSTTGKAADSNLLDGLDSTKFYRTVGDATDTAGPGWVTVAKNQSARHHAEVIVSDAESSDHSFIRIDWMRSYADSNFSVINVGGHANRIQGVRVLSQDSDNTYGWKYLQVYVTTSSSYGVRINSLGTVHGYTSHTAVSPTLQNTISGYSVHGNALTNLQNASLAAEEGITAGGNIVAANFSGSSSGTNTGDQTLPTLSSLGALSTTAKAADSELLDGVDSTRFVYGGNSTKTTNISNFSTALNSGFFDGSSATGAPTATWYTLLNMRHNNTTNNYGSQLAISFYNNSDMYVRTISNGTYAGWSKVYNEANLTPLTIGTTATTAMAGNTTIPSGNAVIDWTVDNDDIVIHSGNYTDTDTWVANSATAAGYVASGANQVNKVWKTDASGNPGWADDRDTDTVYTHPTSAGNKHIPTGGSAGQFLKYSASGTATWAVPSYTTNTNTTYSAGTGLDLTGTTFSVEPDLRDGITYVGKDSSNYIQFDSTNGRIDFYAGGAFVARMEAEGDLHIKGDVIAFSNIFS